MTDGYGTIRYEVTPDRVATITLDRPEVLNAFDRQMCEEVRDAWRRVKDDPAVHAVVLRAAGDRAFCAGLDLKELGSTGGNLGAGSGADGAPNASGRRGPFPALDKPVTHPFPHHPWSPSRVLERFDERPRAGRLPEGILEDRGEREPSNALSGPLGANLTAADSPHFLGVCL